MVSAARLRARAAEAVHDPVRWTDAIQLVKTVAAAVLAWVLAQQVLGLPQPFLAPWSALLVVGVTPLALTLLLVLGLLAGSLTWFREETTTAAATGLIVLTTGYSTHGLILLDRLADTAIGIVVGLVVNLAVWPPLRDYSAARSVGAIDDSVGQLLADMARDLRQGRGGETVTGWVDRTRDLDHDIDQAWSLVRQARESSRLNPRRAAKGLRTTETYEAILRDNEQAVAEARSMARTLGLSIEGVVEWEPEFRSRWLGLLAEAGDAIGVPDAARVTQVHVELNRLAEDLSRADLPGLHWLEYGGLIVNLRNVVTSMDRVAEQNPVVVPRYLRRDRLRRRLGRRVLRGRRAGSWPVRPRRSRSR